jgi:hypothetical protein
MCARCSEQDTTRSKYLFSIYPIHLFIESPATVDGWRYVYRCDTFVSPVASKKGETFDHLEIIFTGRAAHFDNLGISPPPPAYSGDYSFAPFPPA